MAPASTITKQTRGMMMKEKRFVICYEGALRDGDSPEDNYIVVDTAQKVVDFIAAFGHKVPISVVDTKYYDVSYTAEEFIEEFTIQEG